MAENLERRKPRINCVGRDGKHEIEVSIKEGVSKEETTFLRVKTLTGENTSINVNTTDSVQLLKKKIECKLDILPCQQRLFLAGTLLSDNGNLSDYSFCKGDTMFVVRRICNDCEVRSHVHSANDYRTTSSAMHNSMASANQCQNMLLQHQKCPADFGRNNYAYYASCNSFAEASVC